MDSLKDEQYWHCWLPQTENSHIHLVYSLTAHQEVKVYAYKEVNTNWLKQVVVEFICNKKCRWTRFQKVIATEAC